MKASQTVKGNSWSGMLALLSSFFLAIAFLAFGYFSRESILSINPCKMTYTKIDRIPIKVNSSIHSMGLFKYNTHSGHRKALNPQPVLFIPGHKGDVDQVRSLASSMHNGDGYFQYFVIDFRKLDSAYHGSSILKQAVFANDAVEGIRALYASQEAGKQDSEVFHEVPRVIVIAHSIGGVVARAMPLLDNHPFDCGISDIIMLSSPIVSPPYGVDPSTYDLYNAINKAWKGASLNESAACRQALVAAASHSSPSAKRLTRTKAQRVKPVHAEWLCPVCASRIRLLSISGGEIDNLVPTSLAQLAYLAPNPVNNTLQRQRAVAASKGKSGFYGLLTPFRTAMHWMSPQFVFSTMYTVYSSFAGGNSSGNVNATANMTVADNVIVDIIVDGATVNGPTPECSSILSNQSCSANESEVVKHGSAESGASASPVTAASNTTEPSGDIAGSAAINGTNETAEEATSRKSHWHEVTQEAWDRDINPYLEPQHYSVRTSQLHLVGFPIDHNAMLWCHQLLQVCGRNGLL